jgi:tyrosyl-tRNA synthetase
VQQGGAYVNDVVVDDTRKVGATDLKEGAILLRAGKKKYHRVLSS